MKSSVFHEWMKSLPQLSRVQQIHLLEAVNLSINQDEIASSLEENNVPQCNRCGGSHYDRWGKQAGLQRYRCRDCQHTYTVLSGTPLARLRHKDRWLQYSKALIQGLTVRAAATECGVHKNTSFRWRHRFLMLPSRLKPRLLQGIVEADETYFPLSFKGSRHLPRPVHRRGHALRKKGTGQDQVPVLVLRNRQGVTADFKLLVANTKSIEPVLSAVLAPDVMLCSDGAAAYRLATAHLGLSHCAVNLSQGIRVRGAYHVQNVNAYDSRLKNWMTRFHGVATKYLESYLGWRRWLDRAGQNITAKSGIEQAIGKNILFNY